MKWAGLSPFLWFFDPNIENFKPGLTETIWIGKMNHIKKNIVVDCSPVKEEVEHIKAGQTDDSIIQIYEQL